MKEVCNNETDTARRMAIRVDLSWVEQELDQTGNNDPVMG